MIFLNTFFTPPILYLVIAWTLVWKGLALWRAVKNNHLTWYVVLLVLNTLGILEILYFFIFGKKKSSPKEETLKS